jgi:hypothetical protein
METGRGRFQLAETDQDRREPERQGTGNESGDRNTDGARVDSAGQWIRGDVHGGSLPGSVPWRQPHW